MKSTEEKKQLERELNTYPKQAVVRAMSALCCSSMLSSMSIRLVRLLAAAHCARILDEWERDKTKLRAPVDRLKPGGNPHQRAVRKWNRRITAANSASKILMAIWKRDASIAAKFCLGIQSEPNAEKDAES